MKYSLTLRPSRFLDKLKAEEFIHLQDRVTAERKTLVRDRHIEKLDKSTTDHFTAPIMLTAEKN